MSHIKKLEYIEKSALDNALSKEYRQYLTGKLTREQKFLKHIEGDIEIGVSFYSRFTFDKLHKHPVATEYGYILKGAIRIKLLDGSAVEKEFGEGDFFTINPNTPYASKSKANTKILFIKAPGINDKTLVEITPETNAWLNTW